MTFNELRADRLQNPVAGQTEVVVVLQRRHRSTNSSPP
jgi:hypothetical protein